MMIAASRHLALLLLLCWAGATAVMVDVAIIGGGPAGLAAAAAAKRALGPKATVAVFERSPELLQVGGQVGLMSPGFNALDAIDPQGKLSAAVEAAGVQRKLLRTLNKKGELEGEMPIEGRQVVIPWYALQRSLASQLPPDTPLHLGRELEAIEETCVGGDDCLALTFGRRERRREQQQQQQQQQQHQEGGEGEREAEEKRKETVTARLVVGADGNMSRLRALLFGGEQEGGEGPPEYAGSAIWRMFIRGDFEGLENGVSHVWSGDGKVLAMQKMTSPAVGEGSTNYFDKEYNEEEETRVYVSGQAAWPEAELSVLDRRRYVGAEDGSALDGGRSTKSERLGRFAATFEGFPKDVVAFALAHCEVSSVLEHPIYYREPSRPWGKGRCTLVGDAAHCIPPNMASTFTFISSVYRLFPAAPEIDIDS